MRKGNRTIGVVLAGLLAGCLSARAQETPHLTRTQPGGMPGLPVVTGIDQSTNGVRVTWDGPTGYYQLYRTLSLLSPAWQKVGDPNLARAATIAPSADNAFFRVVGPPPQYVGAQVCSECHPGIHASEMETHHARALETLRKVNQAANPDCLRCHTVGFGLPTGFQSVSATPHLGGVQCENCHGPGGNHAANEMDLTARPRAELAGQVCGGCHNTAEHPTFDEWKSSGHFGVIEDMNPAGRISNCGRCHSGSSRLALLDGKDPAVAVAHDANVGITCAVCHDPHAQHVWTNVLSGVVSTNQLRQAVASTNDFFLSTSDTFADKYDPQVNVCAQCHNHRGATWASTSRPPHHSPQYNMMLGTVGELDFGETRYRAAHATQIAKQCIGCHMEFQDEAHPGFPGHSFAVETFDSCIQCHRFPEGLVMFTQSAIANRIQQVKSALDLWATTKAPPALAEKYGVLAWEYTNPGELSSGSPGPNNSEQGLIPDNIKKARFNLYLVRYDGSYGVHNAVHSVRLLDVARGWIQQELNN